RRRNERLRSTWTRPSAASRSSGFDNGTTRDYPGEHHDRLTAHLLRRRPRHVARGRGRAGAHRGGLFADARPRRVPAVQGRARPARRVGGRQARPEEPGRRLAVRRRPPLARRRLTASPTGAAGPAAPLAGITLDVAPTPAGTGAEARLFPSLPVSLQPDPS